MISRKNTLIFLSKSNLGLIIGMIKVITRTKATNVKMFKRELRFRQIAFAGQRQDLQRQAFSTRLL